MKNITLNIGKLCGIYVIFNSKTGDCYVGSSTHIYYRLRRHLSDLRKNKHHSPIFQNSFNKHGEDIFETHIATLCVEEELEDQERICIDIYEARYNTVKNPLRRVLPESSRVMISETLKRRYREGMKSYNQVHNHKWIEIYDFTGTLIKRYSTYTAAERELGLKRGMLSWYSGQNYKTIKRKYQYKTEKNNFEITNLNDRQRKTSYRKK